jgi:hypothetical protein
MHIVSDESLQRPGYVYNEHGVGYPAGMTWSIVWKHIDGPLMHHSDGSLHWLTLRERIWLSLGLTDGDAIDKQYRNGRRIRHRSR